MDNSASEKIDSLKSLNSMLLKETVERRQRLDSLIQSNSSLESQSNRSVAEEVNLESELKFLNEREVMLEIESGLVCIFVSGHVNQLAEDSGNERDEFCRTRVLIEERIESLEREIKRVLAEKIAIESERSEPRCRPITSITPSLFSVTSHRSPPYLPRLFNFLQEMSEKGFTPPVRGRDLLIDGLLNAGYLESAKRLVRKMTKEGIPQSRIKMEGLDFEVQIEATN